MSAKRFPGETASYRGARDELLKAEVGRGAHRYAALDYGGRDR